MNLMRFVYFVVFLCGGYFIVEAQPQYVEPAILIKVIDSEENPIVEPNVVVYDSAHQFVREEIAEESIFGDGVKKIKIKDFGKYYLQFSKNGYEPVEEICIIWKNDVVNRSPRVIMTPSALESSCWWIWCGIGLILLAVLLIGFKVFRKKV